MASEALKILKSAPSVESRAEEFVKSISRNVQRDVIDTLLNRRDNLKDQLFSLKDFSLVTDNNAGQVAITRDQAEKRFKDVIQLEYDMALLDAEIKVKKESFDKLFGIEEKEEQAHEKQ